MKVNSVWMAEKLLAPMKGVGVPVEGRDPSCQGVSRGHEAVDLNSVFDLFEQLIKTLIRIKDVKFAEVQFFIAEIHPQGVENRFARTFANVDKGNGRLLRG